MPKHDGSVILVGCPDEVASSLTAGRVGFVRAVDLDGRYSFFDIPSELRPRTDGLECDETFRQFVTYVLLTRDRTVFGYVRKSRNGETRLKGRASLGFGGHVESQDSKGDPSQWPLGVRHVRLTGAMMAAASREVQEETGLDLMSKSSEGLYFRFRGLIRSVATPVDRVHLGFVYTLDLSGHAFEPTLEPGLHSMGWMDAKTLTEELITDPFESWSRELIPDVIQWLKPKSVDPTWRH